jgi:hypothetical protein
VTWPARGAMRAIKTDIPRHIENGDLSPAALAR